MKLQPAFSIFNKWLAASFLLTLVYIGSIMLPMASRDGSAEEIDGWSYASNPSLVVTTQADHPAPPAVTGWRLFLKNKDALKSPIAAHAKFYVKEKSAAGLSREELNRIGRAYGILDDVLFYQNHIESSGGCISKPNHKGAVGCFQFIKDTASEFGLISDKGDFRNQFHASADAAARYMLWLTIVMYGDKANPQDWEQVRHVLAAYNAGYGTVTRSGTPKIPNFYETIRYVNHIEDLVKKKAVWVNKRDTLDAISRRVNVPVEALLRGNPSVTGDHDLVAGTVLSLPDEHGMSRVIVKRGMSLYGIQGRTGVDVKELIAANRLGKDGLIRVGAVLNIPTKPATTR